MKCCSDCKLTLTDTSFPLRGGGRTGRSSYCRPCIAIRNQRNREKRGKPSAWRKECPINVAFCEWLKTA